MEGSLTTKASVLDTEEFLRREKIEYEKYKREPKILLLGSSDSGKSTLLKQMKIMHADGFTAKEIAISRLRIINGILSAVASLISGATSFELMQTREMYLPLCTFCHDWRQQQSQIDSNTILDIKRAWSDPNLQELVETGLVHLPETTGYFMDNIDRILDPSYTPSNQDILYLRTITQSISDTVFTIDNQRLHIIDVSGLSYHRKQWISYFDDVRTVIFVANLASYDKMMIEDKTVNQMVDAIVLFEEIINHQLLAKKFVLLFLNKKDLYEKKIKKRSIAEYFPQYRGKPGSASQGVKYFEIKFRNQRRGHANEIMTHVTCCTDTKLMKVVMDGVLVGILQGQINKVGM
ncbi:hypothetical protein HDV03_002425 [Kappamyces sp. JEL0829]|nr:hypothetical protein HDV03_002425 [Kappamyces sp. JEL0829]